MGEIPSVAEIILYWFVQYFWVVLLLTWAMGRFAKQARPLAASFYRRARSASFVGVMLLTIAFAMDDLKPGLAPGHFYVLGLLAFAVAGLYFSDARRVNAPVPERRFLPF